MWTKHVGGWVSRLSFKVTFKWREDSGGRSIQQQRVIQTTGNRTILALARENDIKIEATCGGRGRCGRCKVIATGAGNEVSPGEKELLTKEELAAGVRLACYLQPRGDLIIEVPGSQTELVQILTEGSEQAVELDPDIEKECVLVEKPELETPLGDRERLLAALTAPVEEEGISLALMARLPEVLRSQEHKVTVTRRGKKKIIAIESGDTTDHLYGIAFDIGTTTVVGGLIDLRQGKELAVAARLNGQASYGADVISRVEYASNGQKQLCRLQKAVMDTLNGIVAELLQKTGVDAEQIYRVTVVGNTCMQHLALGIPSTYVARSPYTPAFSHRVDLTAAELGLAVYPEAAVTFLPNVAGFVGADTVGVVLATEIAAASHRVLVIDIGTNGELVMVHDGEMVACSTAAGPAFEGAQISCGMRAGEGAIEAVHIGTDVEIGVIGHTRPRGVCGSGLIDAVAELIRCGIIEETGRLLDYTELDYLPPRVRARVRTGENGNEFVLAWADATADGIDITLTQRDIREIQLAKGAIRAGTMILQKALGVKDEDIDEILLAGAFGNYIRKESAMGLGLLPPIDIDRIRSVGNAARVGAKLALVSRHHLEAASQLAQKIDYIELSGRPDFQEAFMEAMMFPTGGKGSQDTTEIDKKLPRDQVV